MQVDMIVLSHRESVRYVVVLISQFAKESILHLGFRYSNLSTDYNLYNDTT